MLPMRVSVAVIAVLFAPSVVTAQDFTRGAAVEGTIGHAAFVDESPVHHRVFGAAYRQQLTPRISVGPELTYMIGPGSDRDLFLMGDVWLDFMRQTATRRVSPYFVAGGGLMVHWPEHSFTGGPYKEGAFGAGFGARIKVGDNWYVAPEARIGWEPHTRLSVNVGYRVKP